MRIIGILFFATALISFRAGAQEGSQDSDKTKAIDSNISKVESAIAGIRGIGDRKQADCMKAIGNKKFCQCFREKSPSGVTFFGYIQIALSDKSEMKYDEVSKEDKTFIDNTWKARDACAGKK